MRKNKIIKISSWNINGIKSAIRKNQLSKYIISSNPDIICFSEIRTNLENLEENNYYYKELNEYYPYSYWNCSNTKKGYSGTAVLSKFKAKKSYFYHEEGRILVCDFGKFNLVNLYCPFSGNNFERLEYRVGNWRKLLDNVLDKFSSKSNISSNNANLDDECSTDKRLINFNKKYFNNDFVIKNNSKLVEYDLDMLNNKIDDNFHYLSQHTTIDPYSINKYDELIDNLMLKEKQLKMDKYNKDMNDYEEERLNETLSIVKSSETCNNDSDNDSSVLDPKKLKKNIRKQDKGLILTGDFNVAHKDIDVYSSIHILPGCTVEERVDFTRMLEKYDLIDSFRYFRPTDLKFTFWSNGYYSRLGNKGLRLDYFLHSKNIKSNVVDCDIRDRILGSDHCPIELLYKV